MVSDPKESCVVVTGASRGIGRATAELLLSQGANVALLARETSRLTDLLQKWPTQALAIGADLLQAEARKTVLPQALQRFGSVRGLVNCAGTVNHGAAVNVTAEELRESMELHVVAALELAQATAQSLRANGQAGAIVNVASTLGIRSDKHTLAYAASKAALISMTQTLALEWAHERIRVNAVAPGVVDTDMIRAAASQNAQGASVHVEHLRSLHLLERFGTPPEVAQAILYLLEAPWVTGTVLVVDGGLLLHPS